MPGFKVWLHRENGRPLKQRSRRHNKQPFRSGGEVRAAVASWPSTKAPSSGRRISSSWTTCPWRNSWPTWSSGKPAPPRAAYLSPWKAATDSSCLLFISPDPEVCVCRWYGNVTGGHLLLMQLLVLYLKPSMVKLRPGAHVLSDKLLSSARRTWRNYINLYK